MRKERDDACDIIIGMNVQLTMNNVQWAGKWSWKWGGGGAWGGGFLMAQRYDFLSYGVIELWNYGGCGYTGMWGWVVGHGAVAGY